MSLAYTHAHVQERHGRKEKREGGRVREEGAKEGSG